MGVVHSRKTGAGASTGAGSPRPASRRQEGDCRLPPGEGRERRRMVAHDLYTRGLTGRLEMICVDGGHGSLAAPPATASRSSAAGRTRYVLDNVRKADQDVVRQDLHAAADNRTKARSAANRFATRWEDVYPKAVACLRDDLDDLLDAPQVQHATHTDICIRPVTRSTCATAGPVRGSALTCELGAPAEVRVSPDVCPVLPSCSHRARWVCTYLVSRALRRPVPAWTRWLADRFRRCGPSPKRSARFGWRRD